MSFKRWLILSSILLTGIVGGINLKWNQVAEVIDGDTFVLGNGQKVRMLGIDAPELEYCGGEEARKELEDKILGEKVKLSQLKVDQYRRILALVYLDESLVNEEMLKSGWVKWDGTRNGEEEKLKEAANRAKEEEIGIYKACRGPDKKECIIKGNIEKRSGESDGGRKLYFYPGCSEYEAVIVEKELGEEWFCTTKEAEEKGYQKAANCW